MPVKPIPAEVPKGAKWCHGCQSVKPIGAFYVNRRAEDGRTTRCKACVKRQAEWRREMLAMFEETRLGLLRKQMGL